MSVSRPNRRDRPDITPAREPRIVQIALWAMIAVRQSGGAAASLDGTDQDFGGNSEFFVEGTDHPKG